MSVQKGFNGHHLAAIDAAIGTAIAARSLPGAVYWLERGAAHVERAYGRLDFAPAAALVTVDTVFDVASLTKVLVTAPAILLLHEAGQIDLEAPLLRYLPECAGGGKDAITLRQLLTHTSGLLAGLPASPAWQGREAAMLLASLERVTHVPGSVFRYSDINYILLGLIIERVAGMPLDAFAEQRIFAPLGMQDTGYRPLARGDGRTIAPTQRGAVDANAVLSKAQRGLAPGAVLQGHVHDPTVRRMGGVAGSPACSRPRGMSRALPACCLRAVNSMACACCMPTACACCAPRSRHQALPRCAAWAWTSIRHLHAGRGAGITGSAATGTRALPAASCGSTHSRKAFMSSCPIGCIRMTATASCRSMPSLERCRRKPYYQLNNKRKNACNCAQHRSRWATINVSARYCARPYLLSTYTECLT